MKVLGNFEKYRLFYVQYAPAISSGNRAGVSAYRLKYYDSNETKIEEIFEKF